MEHFAYAAPYPVPVSGPLAPEEIEVLAVIGALEQ